MKNITETYELPSQLLNLNKKSEDYFNDYDEILEKFKDECLKEFQEQHEFSDDIELFCLEDENYLRISTQVLGSNK